LAAAAVTVSDGEFSAEVEDYGFFSVDGALVFPELFEEVGPRSQRRSVKRF
jgi:hypothetical protein